MTAFERIEEFYRVYATRKVLKNLPLEKKIFIYGSNIRTYQLISKLGAEKANIGGVVDIDAKEYTYSWIGHRVIDVEEFCKINQKARVLLAEDPFVRLRLRKMGLNDAKDFIYIRSRFVEFLRRIDLLNSARKGCGVYKKIRRTIGNKELLVCPYPGTGDAFYTGRYLKSYLEYCGIDNYMIVTCNGSFSKVLMLFDIEDSRILRISSNKMRNLNTYINLVGPQQLSIRYMLYWGISVQKTSLFEGYKGLTFDELFRVCVFGLPFETKAHKMRQVISEKDALRKMEELALPVSNTVVIAPYANSFENELPMKWWETLADTLHKKGFFVATNCGGENEPPINGTIAISFPYDSINVLMEKCGYFIGMRSGLCDVISESNCKKIIIYQSFITDRRMRFFSLSQISSNNLFEFNHIRSIR